MTPNDPPGTAAQPVPEQPQKTEIQQIDDRVRRAESWMIWLTAVIAFFAFCQVGVGIFQWYAMRGQLDEMHNQLIEMQKQTVINRQQLEGTMAAIVTLQEPRVTPDQITGQMLLVVLLFNQDNRIMAQHVHLHFTSFPKTIQPTPTIIEIPQLSKSWSRNYVLANFTKQDEEFVTQKGDFMVEGTFDFDDGFGNKLEQPFCYSYLGRYNVRNEEGGGSTSGGNGFYTCDRFNELKAYLLKHPWK